MNQDRAGFRILPYPVYPCECTRSRALARCVSLTLSLASCALTARATNRETATPTLIHHFAYRIQTYPAVCDTRRRTCRVRVNPVVAGISRIRANSNPGHHAHRRRYFRL